jgi:hypothetical protein
MAEPGKRALNFETVGSIVAMVIGACALFVAWDQAQIMRKQQHASVVPILNIAGGFSSSADSHTLTVVLRNDGIGPAMIESARLTVDGHEIVDWPDLRERFLPENLRTGFHSSLDTTIGVLAAGEKSNAIRITWPSGEETDEAFDALKARAFSEIGDRTVFGVCYCSVFDRCWRTADGQVAKPQPVKRCEDAGEDVVARLLQTISEKPL